MDKSAAAPPRARASAFTVLVVDEARESRLAWGRAIARLGQRVLLAGAAAEALDHLDATCVDAVCTTSSLPDMDGIDLCRAIRASARYGHLPVIVLAPYNTPALRARCRDAGVTDVQIKDETERLLRRLRGYADQTEARVQGRVLYVEDSEVTARVVSAALKVLDLAIDCFTRPDDALAAFDERHYDVVITDIQTESFGGIGLIKRIRAREEARGRTPIIATSADDTRENKSALFRLGIDDFLPKPALEEEIVARVGNIVRGKLLRDQVGAQRARLDDLAMIDALTGLPNAAALREMGPKFVAEAIRHREPLSLVLIVTDAIEEAAVMAVARVLRSSYRGEDLAARMDEQQFAVLLPRCDASDARASGERVGRRIAALPSLNSAVRVAVAAFSGDADAGFDSLLAAARRDLPDPEDKRDAQGHE